MLEKRLRLNQRRGKVSFNPNFEIGIRVYHTTALRGSRYEVPLRVAALDEGGFDAQSLCTVPAVKLIRRRAALNPPQMKAVEEKVKLAVSHLNATNGFVTVFCQLTL